MSINPPLRVGLLVGRERRFSDALIEEVNQRDDGIFCEYVLLGGTRMAETPPYAVLIDQISHEIPYYRAFLKTAVLAGTIVINNPFWRVADDKLFGASLFSLLGLANPRTVALPNHRYVDGVVSDSLRNLVYPIDWQAILDYVGLPAVLKPYWGGSRQETTLIRSKKDLWEAYNRSGTQTMILQEDIRWEHYVRCICIGQEQILPTRYNPHAPLHQRYVVDHEHLSPALGTRILHDARLINRALGYDLNTIEFAIRSDVPYVVEVMNTAHDIDMAALPSIYFQWAVRTTADLLLVRAREAGTPPVPHWQALLATLPPAF